jgi:putative transposase
LNGERPGLKLAHSQVLHNVAVRIDLAMKAFFRRGNDGETPGSPRFRGRTRYNSLTCPQAPGGAKLHDAYLDVFHVGNIVHRPLEGTPETVTLRRTSTGACEWEPTALPPTGQEVGIDVGLKPFATRADGQEIANPRVYRHKEQAVATAQRKLRQEERGTPKRRKRREVVARIHERRAWRRETCTHQHSRRIVNHHALIAVEDLSSNTTFAAPRACTMSRGGSSPHN